MISTVAGRRLANALSPERSVNSPRSGRCSAGSVSHLYLQESDNVHEHRRLKLVAPARPRLRGAQCITPNSCLVPPHAC